MNNLVSKSTKWQKLIRAVYLRFKILRRIRLGYLQLKLRAKLAIQTLGNSSNNLLALQALAHRRLKEHGLSFVSQQDTSTNFPAIDISVVTFNSIQWIEKFFASLILQNYPLSKINLFFVDNNSTDNTVLVLETVLERNAHLFLSTKLIKQENLGFGAGHHRAIIEGTSEYCMVTNLDLEFSANALSAVVHLALTDKKKEVASWELRQIPYEHPKYYDPVTLETNWSSHACILLRRSAYIKVGGYDPKIFMYVEDVELSYRFRSYGYALKYVPSAVVHHFTYKVAAEIKPAQFCGGAIGNMYIRLRYGKPVDWVIGLLLYIAILLRPSPFRGAKKVLLLNMLALLQNLPHFLHGKGSANAYFPLRRFDYEMKREGAFYEIDSPLADDQVATVTVITRTYQGRTAFLSQAIQTVFNQTYPKIELIVVEDGGESQRELLDAMALIAPPSVTLRYIANKKLGRSAAGNTGLATATGEYVMFLDDDDLIFSDHVETLAFALQKNKNFAAAYSLSIEIHTKINPSSLEIIDELYHTPELFFQEWNYDVLLDHNFIPIQAIMFKTELYRERGGFDTALEQLEDWNLWLRYGFQRKFVYIPKSTSLFRSPADGHKRSARHADLHAAYTTAKKRALSCLTEYKTQ